MIGNKRISHRIWDDQRKESSENQIIEKNADANVQMPLLENVRGLINKEKELMGLKLREQEEEAATWRQRYEKLTEELHKDQAVEGNDERARVLQALLLDNAALQPLSDWQMLQQAVQGKCQQLFSSGTVNLSNQGLVMDSLSEAMRKLRWLRNVHAIDVSDNDIDDTCAEQVEDLFGMKLSSLNLSHNRLGAACGAAICRSLRNQEMLQCLQLEGNLDLAACPNFGKSLAGSLLKGYKHGACRRLWGLSVTLHDTRYEGSGRYLRAVFEGCPCQDHEKSSKPKCEYCRRQWAPLPPDDGSPPMNALKFLKTLGSGPGFSGLRYLGLPHAKLTLKTVQALSERIPGLTALDLSNCFIGTPGVQVLSNALMKPEASLVSLVLKRNAVSCPGAGSIAEVLVLNQSLTYLDLSLNDIGNEGGRSIAEALRISRVLSRIDLGHNPMNAETCERIVSLAAQNQSRCNIKIGGVEVMPLPVDVQAQCIEHYNTFVGEELPVQVVPEEVIHPAVNIGGSGFLRMVSTELTAEGMLRISWLARRSMPVSGHGKFVWKITRGRGHLTTVMEEGNESEGQLLPRNVKPKLLGFRRFEVVLDGWEVGDDFGLWMAPSDEYNNPLPPSLLPDAGSLRSQQLEMFRHSDNSYGLLYEDLGTGEAALIKSPVGQGWKEAPAVSEERWLLEDAFDGIGNFDCLHRVWCARSGKMRVSFSLLTDYSDDETSEHHLKTYTWALVRSRPCQPCHLIESGNFENKKTEGGCLISKYGPREWNDIEVLCTDILSGDTMSIWARHQDFQGGNVVAEDGRPSFILKNLRVHSGEMARTERLGGTNALKDAVESKCVALNFSNPLPMNLAAACVEYWW